MVIQAIWLAYSIPCKDTATMNLQNLICASQEQPLIANLLKTPLSMIFKISNSLTLIIAIDNSHHISQETSKNLYLWGKIWQEKGM